MNTLTGFAVFLIFPQEIASSGRAPESLPSNSLAVLTNREKSAPFLWRIWKKYIFATCAYAWKIWNIWEIKRKFSFQSNQLTIKLALQMWCLIRPPPRMIIPVFLAYTAWLFILLISATQWQLHFNYGMTLAFRNYITNNESIIKGDALLLNDRWLFQKTIQ